MACWILIEIKAYKLNYEIELERHNHNTSIYSGSATRTPSLPYSTPRVAYSRVRKHCTTQTPFTWRRSLHNVAYTLSGTKLDTGLFHEVKPNLHRLHFIRYKARYRVLSTADQTKTPNTTRLKDPTSFYTYRLNTSTTPFEKKERTRITFVILEEKNKHVFERL